MLSGQRETCAEQQAHADDCVGGAELRKGLPRADCMSASPQEQFRPRQGLH